MILTSDNRFQESLKRWGKYLVAVILLIAVLVLAGWQFDNHYLIRLMPKLPAMNPATAAAFICFGVSYFILTGKTSSTFIQKTGQAFALIVLLIGVVKFSGVLFGFDLKIDL